MYLQTVLWTTPPFKVPSSLMYQKHYSVSHLSLFTFESFHVWAFHVWAFSCWGVSYWAFWAFSRVILHLQLYWNSLHFSHKFLFLQNNIQEICEISDKQVHKQITTTTTKHDDNKGCQTNKFITDGVYVCTVYVFMHVFMHVHMYVGTLYVYVLFLVRLPLLFPCRRKFHLQLWAAVMRWKLVEREAEFASIHGEWWKVRGRKEWFSSSVWSLGVMYSLCNIRMYATAS